MRSGTYPKPLEVQRQYPVGHDYVTLITTAFRTNKKVGWDDEGYLKKESRASIAKGDAITVPVPDAHAMVALLQEIGDDPCTVMVAGFNPKVPVGVEYRITSNHEIEGTTTLKSGKMICRRTKDNFVPSTWMLFDRDVPKDMPEELADLTIEECVERLDRHVPGFESAAIVHMPSTTGRVLVDGEPLEAKGCHLWVQRRDAYDLERFGTALKLTGLAHGFAVRIETKRKKGRGVTRRLVSIFDPATFSWERLVFNGSPTVEGEGLSLAPPDIRLMRPGGRYDTKRLATPEGEHFGYRVGQFNERRAVRLPDGKVEHIHAPSLCMIEHENLTLDTELELEDGKTITVADFWRSNHAKLRCQAPFRNSTSMNGFIYRDSHGVPRVFDNGPREIHALDPAEAEEFKLDLAKEQFDAMDPDMQKKRWAMHVGNLSPDSREALLLHVYETTKVGKSQLRAQMKAAQERSVDKQNEQEAKEKLRAVRASGLIEVQFNELELRPVAQAISEAISLPCPPYEPVLAYAGALSTVTPARPSSVRQVKRLLEEGVDYPAVLVLKAYDQNRLLMRVQESVQLYAGGEGGVKLINPNPVVLDCTMSEGLQIAPPCSGILVNPCVRADGTVMSGTGLDAQTGLYLNVREKIELPGIITKKKAAQSLKWMREVLLAEWPFKTELDRDIAVSMFLTAVERKMISDESGCLGYSISAPVQSTGKTALAQLLSHLVFDRPLAATTWTDDDEEQAKHLLAILLEGHPCVLFDNLREGEAITGNQLAKAMTSATFKGRLLGHNRQAEAPTGVLWLFTGNNIVTTGDFNTRILPIYLDPEEERPDQRTFTRPDLAGWAQEHRAEFFHHAITIIAGGIRSGVEGPVSRFKEWNQLVLWPLVWAGGLDILEGFESNMVADVKTQERAELLKLWYAVHRSEPIKVKVLGDLTKSDFEAEDPATNELRELLAGMFPRGFNARSFGFMLRTIANRRFGDYSLRQERIDRKGIAEWFVHRYE